MLVLLLCLFFFVCMVSSREGKLFDQMAAGKWNAGQNQTILCVGFHVRILSWSSQESWLARALQEISIDRDEGLGVFYEG